MKKGLSFLVCATSLFGLSQLASANTTSTSGNDQTIDGQADNYTDNTADIIVNGTLGADNTDPDAPLPDDDPNKPDQPNPDWINVTVPIETIFYNTKKNPKIKSPTYTIKNNSGRPVDVNVNTFTHTTTDTLPTDFILNLNLKTTSEKNVAESTPLIASGALKTEFPDYLVTLANNEGKQTKNATAVSDSNLATFTYSGSASVTEKQTSNYKLNLKFVPVTTAFNQ